MFLKTRTSDRFKLCYEGDPAVKSTKKTELELEWIELESAKMKSGEKPDVMVCRPLNADECLRLVDAVERDKSFILYASQLAVTSIEMGNGTIINEPDKITDILQHPGNMQSICSLGVKVFEISKGGEEHLPFRAESSDSV